MAPGKVPGQGALRGTAQRRSVCLPADQEARRVVSAPFLQAAFPGRCLSRCLYLLHVERNGDVVSMTSYAPLFARKGATNWNPDLIYFDNERPFLTCSYYVQQMFGQSSGQYYYGDCVRFDKLRMKNEELRIKEVGEKDEELVGQSVVLNVKTRRLFVKLCNAGAEAHTATLDLSRFGNVKTATKTVLSGAPDAENNFDQQPIAPQSNTIRMKNRMTLDLAPYSFVMLEIPLK